MMSNRDRLIRTALSGSAFGTHEAIQRIRRYYLEDTSQIYKVTKDASNNSLRSGGEANALWPT